MLSHRHARAGYQWDPNAGEFGEFVEHHQIAATPAAAAAPGAEHAEASHGQAAVAEEVLRSLDESLDELNFDDLNASLEESSTSLLPLRLTRSLSPADKAMAQLLGSAFWDPEAPTAAGVGWEPSSSSSEDEDFPVGWEPSSSSSEDEDFPGLEIAAARRERQRRRKQLRQLRRLDLPDPEPDVGPGRRDDDEGGGAGSSTGGSSAAPPAPSPQLPPPPPPPPPPTPDRHRQSPTYTNMRPGYYHPVAASLYNFVPDKGYGQPFIAVSSFQKHGEGQMSSEVVSDASRAWWWSADFQLWAASTPTPSTELSSIPSAAASTPIESEAVHAYERATGDSDGQSGGRPLLVPSARWRSAACVVWCGGAAEAPA